MADAVTCVIPAFNAAATVASVAGGLRRALPNAVLLGIDDGSTDGTGAILHLVCDRVIVHPDNKGKGAALRTGFASALASGAGIIVTIDADGQHEPASAPALVAALGEADLVIGARSREAGVMPFGRRLTNRMSAAAMSICAGQPLPDGQSGFRAMRAEVADRIRPAGDRYEFETAFLILAARAGYRIGAVPIATLYGPPSHFHPVHDASLVIRTIWQHRPSARPRCAS